MSIPTVLRPAVASGKGLLSAAKTYRMLPDADTGSEVVENLAAAGYAGSINFANYLLSENPQKHDLDNLIDDLAEDIAEVDYPYDHDSYR